MGSVVEAVDVGRRYRHGVTGPETLTWKKLLSNRRPNRSLEPIWAVRHVDFALSAGRSLGLVGPNGAGKSTMLQLLGGIGLPDEGEIKVKGRVSALFDLGQDFHPELTGRDNARIAGVIAGFTRKEVQRRMPDITDFAGLGRFIDSPLRVYSTGMKARLAFAVAIHAEPEILLVDEVLAVGDIGFQRRCTQRIKELRGAGVTIVVASHSVEEVRSLCDEVMWLRGGRVIAIGSPDEVLDRYSEVTSEETRLLTPLSTDGSGPAGSVKLDLHENRFGTQEATIDLFRILDCWDQERSSLPTSSSVRIEITASVPLDFQQVNLSIKLVRRRDGLVCLDTSTQVTPMTGSTEAVADIGRLDLAPGDYAFDVGVYTEDWDRTLDFHKAAYRLQVTGPGPADAVMAPPVDWTIADHSTPEDLGPVPR